MNTGVRRIVSGLLCAACGGLIMLGGGTAAAVELIVVPAVPEGVENPLVKQALSAKRAELLQLRGALQAEVNAFQARAQAVPEDRKSAILAEKRVLADKLANYSRRIQKFSAELRRDFGQVLAGSVKIKGDVSVQNEDGSWRPLKPGEAVLGSTPLKTGANGSLELNFGDHVQRIGPNTALTLEPDPLADSGLSSLENGVLRWCSIAGAVAKKTIEREYRVRTLNVTVAVRGTDFVAGHDDRLQLTTIHLSIGELEIAAAGAAKPMRVSGRVTVRIAADGAAEIMPLTDDAWNAAQALLEPAGP